MKFPLCIFRLATFLLWMGAMVAWGNEIEGEPVGVERDVPQELGKVAGEAIPDAPANLVYDNGNAFTREEQQAFSEKLLALKEQDGVTIYLAAYTFVAGETADERARRLCRQWLGGAPGAVILFEKGGSSELAFAAQPDHGKFLTSAALRDIFVRAKLAADNAPENSTPVARIGLALDSLILDFKNEAVPIMVEQQKLLGADQLRVLAVVFCSLAVCLLLLFLAGKLQKKSVRRLAEKYLFPEVQVVPRLGAVHGGGVVALLEVGGEGKPKSSTQAATARP